MFAKFRRSTVGLWFCLLCVLATIILCSNDLVIAKHYRRVRRDDIEITCANGGTWHEKSQRCVCKLGWVGSRCTVWRHHECYFDSGFNYRGRVSRTQSGKPCVPWTTSENSRFELGKNGIGVHNFCRNPDNDEKGLWCYVGGEKFVSFCNITICPASYKAILLINATELGHSDTGSAAVQFVFGPLISGVCAGVVALLAFIVIAEYVRRKRYKARLRRQKKYGCEKKPKKGKRFEEEKEKSFDGTGIRTLGGIVTVDVDTGNEKFQTYSAEDLPNSPQALLAISMAETSSSYLCRDENKQRLRSLSVDALEKGPPPPYHQHGFHSIDEEYVSSNDYASNDVTIQINDDKMSGSGNVNNRQRRTHQKRRERKGERREGIHRSIDSHQSETVVIEEQDELDIIADGIAHQTTDSIRPIPFPRRSITHMKEDEGSKDNEETKKTRNEREASSHEKSKERKKKSHMKTILAERSLYDGLEGFSDPQRPAGKANKRKSRITSHSSEIKQRQRAESHKSYDSQPVKTRKGKSQRDRTRKVSESDISRKRKSAKDIQKIFEVEGTDAGKLPNKHDSHRESKVVKEKCNKKQFVTVINDKNEPTTFL